MLLPLLLYGALAALALWATWRDIDLRWVGLWLAGGFISSNVLFFSVPIFARVGPYTFIEVLVAVAAMGGVAGTSLPRAGRAGRRQPRLDRLQRRFRAE